MNIKMNGQEVDLVVGMLAQGKYIDVYQLIDSIQIQRREQRREYYGELTGTHDFDEVKHTDCELEQAAPYTYSLDTVDADFDYLNFTYEYDVWMGSRGFVESDLTKKLRDFPRFMTECEAIFDGHKFHAFKTYVPVAELDRCIDFLAATADACIYDIYQDLDNRIVVEYGICNSQGDKA